MLLERREILMRETVPGSGEFVADGRGSLAPEVLARLFEDPKSREAFLEFYALLRALRTNTV